MSTTDLQPEAGDQPAAGSRRRKRRSRGQDRDVPGVRHTRIGAVWMAVIVVAILGVALIDFIVQNTRSVRIEFFAASGQIPVAVALLGAALAGAFLVLAAGIARTTQLRLATRRGKKRGDTTDPEASAGHVES